MGSGAIEDILWKDGIRADVYPGPLGYQWEISSGATVDRVLGVLFKAGFTSEQAEIRYMTGTVVIRAERKY